MKTNNGCKMVLAMALVLGMMLSANVVAAEETFTGFVDENDEGAFILSADDGEDYLLRGNGLGSMVGRTVKITGALMEGSDPKTISVMKIIEVEEVEGDDEEEEGLDDE